MTLPLFESLRSALQALRRPPTSADPEVQRAVEMLARRPQGSRTLGFFTSAPDAGQRLADALAENGQQLSDAQLKNLLDSIKAVEDVRSARRRFAVQAVVSAVVLLAAMALIAFGKPTADRDKAFFGLIGTVIGYWLR